jgi:Mg-chelatase subunit ChlD
MRLAELLAIVAICPLGIAASGCARIEQPIGQYRASSTRPTHNATGAQNPPTTSQNQPNGVRGSDASAGSGEPSEDVDSENRMLPDPVLQTDPPGSETPPTGQNVNPITETCYMGVEAAERKRLDMYLVIDANVTIPYSGAWDVAADGVRMFLEAPASKGIGVGLRFYGSECNTDAYLEPTVEVGKLPDAQAELIAGTMLSADYQASPMVYALQGGIQHQIDRAERYPDWRQIVVLITDGFTQDLQCRNYTLQDVQDAAADGFASDIETFVIGYGAPDTMSPIADEILGRFSVLHGIARDGGSREAGSVKFNDDPEVMANALAKIRRTAQPCSYLFPENADPANINLSYLPNSYVPRVDRVEECGQLASGFFYAPEGAEKPTSVELCPATCRQLQSGDYGAVFYLGCPTVRRND